MNLNRINMLKLLNKLIFIALLLSLNAYSALNLELTQGVDKALPIAIVPFTNGTDVSAVINTDLENSGVFRLMNDEQDAANIDNNNYWKQQKVNSIITGRVTTIGDQYSIKFKLLDVYGNSVLLDQQFSANKQDFRSLAHHISDLIYQKLIGIRGIFSTRIAYVLVQRIPGKSTQYKLLIADADGFNPQVMLKSTQPIMSPAWSPDGKKIAYVSFEDKVAAIYLQTVASGERTLISKLPGINGAPAWSPDGTKLTLVLTKTGYPKIYTLDLASKHLRQITKGPSLDTEPNWSPDGKSIIFTSDRGGSPQIYQANIKTQKIKRITYKGNYNARASFTANGKSIVMLHSEGGMFNIALQDLASGRIDILTKSRMDESPSIAPNDAMIVYATNYGGQGVLGEASVDGKVKLRLPAQDGEVQEPAWSPFLT